MVLEAQARPRAIRRLAAFIAAIPASAAAAQEEEQPSIQLTGIIRDFHERTADNGHPDFEREPDGGFGLYAGLVEQELGPDDKPIYAGPGFKVTSDWTDAEGNAIAPHLHNKRWTSGGLEIPGIYGVTMQDTNGVDAFEVTFLSRIFNSNGTSTWTYHARELSTGRNLRRLIIKLDPFHNVMGGTTPGYSYGLDSGTGFFGCRWNLSKNWTEGTFSIVLDRHYDGAITSNGVLGKAGANWDTDTMYVPTASTTGSVAGDCTLIDDPSLNDDAGSSGGSYTGGIDSYDSFRQWYRDVPGVNLSSLQHLNLVRQSDGNYVFDAATDPEYQGLGGFFPLDGKLFGNSAGSPHNYHFTLELHTTFAYHEDAGQMFRFTGDDDVWVYIDGKLVIDLGGVHSVQEQTIDLDRMCLEDGETYSLDFFFAERHRTQSNFRITTNIELVTNGLPTITYAYD